MVDDQAHQLDDDGPGGLSRRSIALLAGGLLAALAAGALLWGTTGDVAPTVADEASGARCAHCGSP